MLELKVNGGTRRVEADPATPLLWVLRDHLGLPGTKYGCGRGLCGACTVHLDGRAARSCVLPVASVGEREVTTIEGLSPDGSHPVQRAWLEEDVPQCGYCQSGQIMACAALLAQRPEAGEEELVRTLSRNLCRCGTYLRIRRAAVRAVQLARATGRHQP
jgi:isoquinoline 1-oxidoreductase alpha subunit